MKEFINNEILEEIIYFSYVDKFIYDLPVDVFIDDSSEYKHYNHQQVLFARNSYDKSEEQFIAISISNEPQILSNIEINISKEDLQKLLNWVHKYNDALKKISSGELSRIDLYYIAAVNRIESNK